VVRSSSTSALAVSVIVPAHDAEATLGRTLAALAEQDLGQPYEVLVVDDGSTDATAAVVERTSARLIRQRPAAGAAAARNRGAAEATAPVLAFTDSDCFPRPDWLSHGLSCLERADLVIGGVRPEQGVRMHPFDRSLVVERETGLYETANAFMRRALFEQLGGFESWIFDRGRPLSEDTWLGWRARRTGARTAFCDQALVEHAILPRGPRAYLEERLRLRHFPTMVERIPELREQFLYARWFLTPRTAAFDVALVAASGARATRSPLPLVAALPYMRQVVRRVRTYRNRAPLVAAVDVAADATGLASLLFGSLRRRTIVL
jgi:glycosyltransferase involved in cell wall biosynthesis